MNFPPGAGEGQRRGRRWRRHRRTVGTLLVTAAAAYGAYRLARWYWGDDDDDDREPGTGDDDDRPLPTHWGHMRQSPRPLHYRRDAPRRAARRRHCEERVLQALPGFGVQLRAPIEYATNVSEEIRRLKAVRAAGAADREARDREQAALWEAVKVKSVTLVLATAYAHAILFLALSVSTCIVFGREEPRPPTMAPEKPPDDVDPRTDPGNADDFDAAEAHQFVLRHVLAAFFPSGNGGPAIDSGLPRLLGAVRAAVAAQMAEWNALDPAYLSVTPVQLRQALDAVYRSVTARDPTATIAAEHEGTAVDLMQFLAAPEPLPSRAPEEHREHRGRTDGATDQRNVADLKRRLLDETWDILESPVCRDAQRACVRRYQQNLERELFGDEKSLAALPLTTILTKLRKLSKGFYDTSESCMSLHGYLKDIRDLPPIRELYDVSFD